MPNMRLLNYKNRPIHACVKNGEDVMFLFDSGAATPVWCMGEKKLRRVFPDAVKKETVCHVSGFGRESLEGSVYVIPLFELSDGTISYKIINLQLAVCTAPGIGCDFVMSDTMFSKTDTVIKRRGEKCLEVIFDRDEYYCTPKYSSTGNRFSVSVWSNM